MSKIRTLRLLGFLLMTYCLSSTLIRFSEMKMINVLLGTSCNITKYLVDPDSIFDIDTLDRTSDDDRKFVDCEMSFTSSREDGRLCIIQDGPVNEIKDSNVEMVVKENTTLVFKLVYYPSRWGVREYCTQSPSLNVALKKININTHVDVRKLAITLKIVNIESRYRSFYFHDISCGHTYNLRHSWLSVYNLSPHPAEILQYCGLGIEKEASNNRSICLVYRPLLSQQQDTEWEFYVSTKHFNLDPNFFIYRLDWKSLEARTLHARCADPEIRFVTLILHRLNMKNEQKNMFVVTVTDYDGTNDTLLEMWTKPHGPKGASNLRLHDSIPRPLTLVLSLIPYMVVDALLA